MLISILFGSPNVDPVAVVSQDLLGAGGTEMSTHGKHMLERKKDTKPKFTARWRAMREVRKAVVAGLFSCNGLMATSIHVCARMCMCVHGVCACVHVFSALLLLSSLNNLREISLLF